MKNDRLKLNLKFLKKLKRISLYAKNLSFFKKDGYIQIPFLANSPEEMIEGFKKIPFSNVDEDNGHITYNNFCINADIRYIEVEQGLWFMITKVISKKNIGSVAIYDTEACNYFSLFYNVRITNAKIKTKKWSLYSPKSRIVAYLPEGTEVELFNFFFDENWIKININLKRNLFLRDFLDKKMECIVSDDYTKNDIHTTNMISYLMENRNSPLYQHFELKKLINELINNYLEHLVNSNRSLSHEEYSIIVIVEKLLVSSIYQSLPNFSVFTNATKCYGNKLRSIMKKHYGDGGLKKEHHKRRMILAAELIKPNKGKSIKEIAYDLGYENFNKFSTAYKNHFGYPPSET